MLRPSVAVLRPSVAVLRPSVVVLRPSVVVLRPSVVVLRPDVAVLRPLRSRPSASRSASANRAQGRFANRPCFAALRAGRASATPRHPNRARP